MTDETERRRGLLRNVDRFYADLRESARLTEIDGLAQVTVAEHVLGAVEEIVASLEGSSEFGVAFQPEGLRSAPLLVLYSEAVSHPERRQWILQGDSLLNTLDQRTDDELTEEISVRASACALSPDLSAYVDDTPCLEFVSRPCDGRVIILHAGPMDGFTLLSLRDAVRDAVHIGLEELATRDDFARLDFKKDELGRAVALWARSREEQSRVGLGSVTAQEEEQPRLTDAEQPVRTRTAADIVSALALTLNMSAVRQSNPDSALFDATTVAGVVRDGKDEYPVQIVDDEASVAAQLYRLAEGKKTSKVVGYIVAAGALRGMVTTLVPMFAERGYSVLFEPDLTRQE